MRIISDTSTILEQILNSETQAVKYKIQNDDGSIADLQWIFETSLSDISALVAGRCIQKIAYPDGRVQINRYKGLFYFKAKPASIEFLDGEMVGTEIPRLTSEQATTKTILEGVFKEGKLWIGEIRFSSASGLDPSFNFPTQLVKMQHFDSAFMDPNHPFGVLRLQRFENQSSVQLNFHAFNTEAARINQHEFRGSEHNLFLEFFVREQDFVIRLKRSFLEGVFRTGDGLNHRPRLIQGLLTSHDYDQGRCMQLQKNGHFDDEGRLDYGPRGERAVPGQEIKHQILGDNKVFIYGLTGLFQKGYISKGYQHWRQFHPIKKEQEIFHYFGKFSPMEVPSGHFRSKFDDDNGRLYMVRDPHTYHVLVKFKNNVHQNPLHMYEIRIENQTIADIKKLSRRSLDACYEEIWHARPSVPEIIFKMVHPFKLSAEARYNESGFCSLMMDDLVKMSAIHPQNLLVVLSNLSGLGDQLHQSMQTKLLMEDEREVQESKKSKDRKRSEQRHQKILRDEQKQHQKFQEQRSWLSQQEQSKREEMMRENQQQWHSLKDHFFNGKSRLKASFQAQDKYTQTVQKPNSTKSFLELKLISDQRGSRFYTDAAHHLNLKSRSRLTTKSTEFSPQLLNDHNLIMHYESQTQDSSSAKVCKWVSDQLSSDIHHFYVILHIKDSCAQKFIFLNMIFNQVMRQHHQVQGKVEKSVYAMHEEQVHQVLSAERYEGLFESQADYHEPFEDLPLKLVHGSYFKIFEGHMLKYQVQSSDPDQLRYLESCAAVPNASPLLP